MATTVLQELRHASVRAITGTTLDYNGDWSALFDKYNIPLSDWNGRLLMYLNYYMGTSYNALPQAQNAFAVALGISGVNRWDEIGTFTASATKYKVSAAPGTNWDFPVPPRLNVPRRYWFGRGPSIVAGGASILFAGTTQ
jgi:hypothetical protein